MVRSLIKLTSTHDNDIACRNYILATTDQSQKILLYPCMTAIETWVKLTFSMQQEQMTPFIKVGRNSTISSTILKKKCDKNGIFFHRQPTKRDE